MRKIKGPVEIAVDDKTRYKRIGGIAIDDFRRFETRVISTFCFNRKWTREGYRWRLIDAEFKNRVLTGAIINLDYIEPRYFLHDAENTVTNNITAAIASHDAVKVNTELNNEFINSDRRNL